MNEELKKSIINTLMSKDVLVTESIMKRIESLDNIDDDGVLITLKNNNMLILDDEFYSGISTEKSNIKDYEWNVTYIPEKKDVEKKKDPVNYSDSNSPVKIVYNYAGVSKKREMNDFAHLFKKRYYSLMRLLQGRKELANLISISRLQGRTDKESVAFIGMVSDKSETVNGNIILTIEDDTGTIRVIITKKNNAIFDIARDVVLDEVVGITGMLGENIVFANNIIFPDVPLSKELKKSPLDEYVLFISDLHFGSKYFLKKEWAKLIKWINGDIGKESHKEIVKKIRYLVICGDLVEGVGIYPGQDKDLEYPSIYDQYNLVVEELKKISEDIHIIIIPGNHDAVRVADPQPPIAEKYVPELYKMKNVYMLSSPSIVNIGSTNNFSGLDLLLYHGYSYTYYAENIPSIRDNGGMKRADLVLKFYLQRRHLGITHGALQYVPDSHDALLISSVPDVLVTGHIHRTTADTYRNVTLLNCSTWIGMTDFQEKVGLEPEPARAILMSLKTRQIKIMNFSEKEKSEEKNEENKEGAKQDLNEKSEEKKDSKTQE